MVVRRYFTALMAAATLSAVATFSAANPAHASCAAQWSAWQHFKSEFVRADGRVEDVDSPRHHTVSEGQAYALFFALVADDRATFERILLWTENNLAEGDLSAQLPAWWWGQRDDGSWGVLDVNAASDADIWVAYTLGEAGRIWNERRYVALSRLLAQRILDAETARIPDFGLTLLPGPQGFHPTASSWRLNASYAPVQLLRRLARNDAAQAAAWNEIITTSVALIRASAPHGFVPDWSLYTVGRGVLPDAQTQAVGSYDAIRVYLWAGMLASADPFAASLRESLQPFARYVIAQGQPPEKVDTVSGKTSDTTTDKAAPAGFSAAAAPLLERYSPTVAPRLWQRIERDPPPRTAYYNWALTVFATGFRDRHFQFAANGDLLREGNVCATR